MEIVIESEPYRATSPAYLRSPQQPLVNTNSAFYYATLPRGRTTAPTEGAPDGAPTTNAVRRVDKSGLLEIADLEPVARPAGPRHLRSGLLEAVPEVPDQCHRTGLASEELLAAAATARSMVERQQHLLGAETDVVESALRRRRSFEVPEPGPPEPPETTARVVKFATDDVLLEEELRKTSLVDCLARTNPRERPATLSNIPDVIEAHEASTTTNATTGSAPEGERAEAEGCEHTALETVEESRVAYKPGAAPAKMPHNDNIQAVHVIILSEQL